MNQDALTHQPVMVAEVLEGLNIQENGIYIDATFGRGGHARAILQHLGSKGQLFALDKDRAALSTAQSLAANDARFHFELSSFAELQALCESHNLVGKVAGILMDLGVSSPQLDTPERGFSFRLEGPLDMRMDQTRGITAAEWLNTAEEKEIDTALKEYGEERFHKRIAAAIVKARALQPLTTTRELAEIVSKANPAWEHHKHPATRSFQAIRMVVNRELMEISQGLEQAVKVLTNEGRLVVISFHSLEDRLVKQFIQQQVQGAKTPRRLPVSAKDQGQGQTLRRIGKKLKPSEAEIQQNLRARSAIVRIAEKVCAS